MGLIRNIFCIFSFFLYVIYASVTTIYADIHTVGPVDCSANSVNSAILAASDGDIVELTCRGTVNWNSTVNVPNSKGITLRVLGGTNTPKTSSNFPLTVSSSSNPIMSVNCENNNSITRVTGFKFTNTIASSLGAIYVSGRGIGKTGDGAYRIDNNYFVDIQLPHADLYGTVTLNSSTGVLTGVVDNNTFRDCSYTDGYTIAVIEMWKYNGSDWSYAGMNAWAREFSFGSKDFAFIEDNLIENVNRYTRHMIMGIQGAKYVARYNLFDINVAGSGPTYSQVIDAHGDCICSSIGAGARGGEIYQNTFKGTMNKHNKVLLRGGTWLVYDNTFLTESVSVLGQMALKEYRADPSGCTQCTTTCSSQVPWNRCVTDSPSQYPLPQQISGSYFWNNKYNGSNILPVVDQGGYQPTYIQSNRDYFTSTTKLPTLASYVPYTYPHPLREEPSILQSPRNFRISQ
jgi:hypothetical protein